MFSEHFSTEQTNRFWEKVNIPNDPESCWEWTASTDKDGYGRFWNKDRTVRAHRFSWEIENGIIPEGFQVLHECDNSSCVNPNHLFLGTNADNIRDKISKGRQNNVSGEKHGHAKLTWLQVREIRSRYVKGSFDHNIDVLGKEYGVSRALIHLIVSNKIWVET